MRLLPFAALLVACSGSTEVPGTPSRTAGASGAEEPTGPAPREVPQGRFLGEGAGCSDLIAYRATGDGTQYVVITIDKAGLGLGVGTTRAFDLGEGPAFVEVNVDVYAAAVGPDAYCTDSARSPAPRTRWTAQAGTLTIALAADAGDGRAGTYRATVRLEGAHFVGPEGGLAVVVPRVDIEDVVVGWLPG